MQLEYIIIKTYDSKTKEALIQLLEDHKGAHFEGTLESDELNILGRYHKDKLLEEQLILGT